MDPELKQRLVGVIVITALAAIFVPMLFDDPVADNSKLISELAIPVPPTGKFSSSIKKLPASTDEVLQLPPPESLRIESEKHSIAAKVDKTRVTSEVQEKKPAGMLRWVIQVGSFSQKSTAIALKNTLRKQGFSAFVESFETEKNNEMHRVRVGPELDKKRAEVMQKKINEKNNLQSILVSE